MWEYVNDSPRNWMLWSSFDSYTRCLLNPTNGIQRSVRSQKWISHFGWLVHGSLLTVISLLDYRELVTGTSFIIWSYIDSKDFGRQMSAFFFMCSFGWPQIQQFKLHILNDPWRLSTCEQGTEFLQSFGPPWSCSAGCFTVFPFNQIVKDRTGQARSLTEFS